LEPGHASGCWNIRTILAKNQQADYTEPNPASGQMTLEMDSPF
jgi:hypothetical protein